MIGNLETYASGPTFENQSEFVVRVVFFRVQVIPAFE